MLGKIWGIHGGDYKECRLLWNKNPDRISGETNTLRLRYRAQPVNSMWDLKFSRRWLWRMPSSGMLRRVALVRADGSEESIASTIRVTRIGELWATLAVTSERSTLHHFTGVGILQAFSCSFHNVQATSEEHPASFTVGTGDIVAWACRNLKQE
jgi:hypothetical protein